MNRKSQGRFRLASAIRKSILPVAGGLVIANPFLALDSLALPQGGQVKAGLVSISQGQNLTVIHQQSSRAVIQWNSFNVNKNESVNFIQPSASSAILNRIVDQNPSQILGNLTANGRVFLINPNGIVFGKTARVNVAGIVASSLNITNEDFMAGNYLFSGKNSNASAKIINKGLINASSGGVTLIGSNVKNEGRIYARLGHVALVSANKVSIDFDGDGLIQFEVDKELIDKDHLVEAQLSNTGEIIAEGGHVILTAQTSRDVFTRVVNNDGVIKASRIENRGGDVYLLGGNDSDIVNTGSIDVSAVNREDIAGNILLQGGEIEASGQLIANSDNTAAGGTIRLLGTEKVELEAAVSASGGKVHITARKVTIDDNALIDVSAAGDAGEILIGGDFQGKGELSNAEVTEVAEKARIIADSKDNGDGGKVIIWSDKKTSFKGNISAQGGSESGDGGFVEVSSKRRLLFQGYVDTRADKGSVGTLLLDPDFIQVADSFTTPHEDDWDEDEIAYGESPGDSITISRAQLEAIDANVILQALVGIEFDAMSLNMKKDLTLETRNSISQGDAGLLSGKTHGVDLSKAAISLNDGKLTIRAGQNIEADNDINAAVKLGTISAKNGVDIYSSGNIILQDDISSDAGINLYAGTDADIADSAIVLNKSLFNTVLSLSSSNGSLFLGKTVDGQGNHELILNAVNAEVDFADMKNVKGLTVNTAGLKLNNSLQIQGDIDFSNVTNTTIEADITLDSSTSNIILGQNTDSNALAAHTLTLNAQALSAGELGQLNTLRELLLNVSTVQLNGSITSDEGLDFSMVNSLTVNGQHSLSSNLNNINLSSTLLNGGELSLNAVNGDVSLGSVSLQSLSVAAVNTRLSKNVQTTFTLDLNNSRSVVLENNLTLSSVSDSILIDSRIDGADYNLSLSAALTELGEINVNDLLITKNNSITRLNGDINVHNRIVFAANSRLNLNRDVSISSTGDQMLARQISGAAELNLSSQGGRIDLYAVDTSALTVSNSGDTYLHADISTLNNMDFSTAARISAAEDIILQSVNANIDLATGLSSQNNSVQLNSTAAIKLGNSSFKDLQVSADRFIISGEINTRNSPDFTAVNALLVETGSTLKSTEANIDLSQTSLSGEALRLSALNGDVSLAQVNLQSIKVAAKNTHLNNDINSNGVVEFTNSGSLLLNNSLSLKSIADSITINGSITGLTHTLQLDADNIALEDVSVFDLAIIRDGSTTDLNGDITVQNSLFFADNSVLNLQKNTRISAQNRQHQAAQINGSVDLTLNGGSGILELQRIDTDALSIVNLGNTQLQGDITTQNKMDFSAAAQIQLINNIVLESIAGSIDLSSGLKNQNKSIQLKSTGEIKLGDTEVQQLQISADSLQLSGVIRTQQTLDMSNVRRTIINTDISLNSIQGDIIFAQTSLEGDVLSLNALNGDVSLADADLQALTVNSENIVLHQQIDVSDILHINNSEAVLLADNITLKSLSGSIIIENFINSPIYNLSLDADTISLGKTQLNQLSITRVGSSTDLYADISVQDSIVFAADSQLNLQNNVSLLSLGEQKLAGQIKGEFDLLLSSQGGKLDVQSINTRALTIINTGETSLQADITTLNNMDFSAAGQIKLAADITLQSTSGSIDLSQGLTQSAQHLRLNAADKIILGTLDTTSLQISAETLALQADITTQGNIDLSAVTDISLEADIKLDSNSGRILLGQNVEDYSTDTSRLEIKAKNINLQNIGQTQRLKSLLLNSDNVNISGNISTTGSLDFTQIKTAAVSGTISLTSTQADIDFSRTELGGENLTLNAVNGNVRLADVDLQSLIVTADNTLLNSTVETSGLLDLNNSSGVVLKNSLQLKSRSDRILIDSRIDGVAYNLTLDADRIELAETNINQLAITRNGSRTDLNGDINAQDQIVFADNSVLNLLQDSSLSSQGDQLLAEQISGAFELSLNSQGGRVDVKQIDTDALLISNTGETIINSNISTENNMDFSAAVQLNFQSDISLESISGDIDLSSALNNTDVKLKLNAGGEIKLAAAALESIQVNADTLLLQNNVSTSGDINLRNVAETRVAADIVLNSRNRGVLLGKNINDSSTQSHTLTIQAQNISLENIGQNTELKALQLSADTVQLSGNISTADSLNFSSVAAADIDAISHLSSSNGNINFSQTELSGNTLTLTALNGEVSLAEVKLQSLSVNAQNTRLNKDIETTGLLNLNNSASVVLANSLQLKSRSDKIRVNSRLEGESFNLSLDADTIELKDISVNDLVIARTASRMDLKGNIAAGNRIDFADNTRLNLLQNTSLTSRGDQTLAEHISGAFDLSLNSQGGRMELNNFNINSLSIVNNGTTNLNGDIITRNTMDFSAASQLNIEADIRLENRQGDLNLSQGLDAYNQRLILKSGRDILLGNSRVQSLDVTAARVVVSGDIDSRENINFGGVNSTIINGQRKIKSTLGNIDFSQTQLSGEQLSLSAYNGELSLNSVALDNISLSASKVSLYNNIISTGIMDFTNTDNIVLKNNLTLSSKADDILINSAINGRAFNLVVDAQSVKLADVNVNNLSISHSAGQTELSGSIQTQGAISFADNSALSLKKDTSLFSQGDQRLAENITGNVKLQLSSQGGQLQLNNVDTDVLTIVNSGETLLNSNIQTRSKLDLSAAKQVKITNDISLKSTSGNINLSNGLSNQQQTLELESNALITLGESELKQLLIRADELQISGNITTLESLDFKAVNSAGVSGERRLNSLGGNIDFSKTALHGDTLSLTAVNGEVSLSEVNLQSLSVNARNTRLNKDIETTGLLDLNNSTSVILANSLLLKSRTDKIRIASRLDGQNYNLTIDADRLELNDININDLTISREKSMTTLKGDINARKNIVFADNSTLDLLQDSRIAAQGDMLMAENIKGAFALNLSSQGGKLKVNNINTETLSIVNTGETHLENNIITRKDLQLGSAANILAGRDVLLQSTEGNIDLSQGLKSTRQNLQIKAEKDIMLGTIQVKSLQASAASLNLSGNISSQGKVDLSDVETTVISTDLTINSNNNTIKLGKNIDDSVPESHILDLQSQYVSMQNMGQNISLKQLRLNTDTIDISGDIKTREGLDFRSVSTAGVIGIREINSTKGNINLSQTHLNGDQLTLKAVDGDVSLGLIDLGKLTVYARNAHLYKDIETTYTLDLNNATTVVLENSLRLKSQNDRLNLNTTIDAGNYDLLLDAAGIILGDTNVNSLTVERNDSIIDLNGNISAQKSIRFSDNNSLNLKKDIRIKSGGNLNLSEQVNGNAALTLESTDIDGLINLYSVNVRSLDVINPGITYLNKDITTKNDLNLSRAVQLDLLSDIILSSGQQEIVLAHTLKGNGNLLSLFADSAILSRIEGVRILKVAADQVVLKASISAAEQVDLSQSEQLRIAADIDINADSKISLSQSVYADKADAFSLALNADNITIEQLGLSDKEINNVSISADNVLISSGISSSGDINLKQSKNLLIQGQVSLDNSSGTGTIILNDTRLSGGELSINAGKNMLLLGDSSLASLRVKAKETELYADIRTVSDLDLAQSDFVKFRTDISDAISVSSQQGGIFLNTHVNADGVNLSIDSDSVFIGEQSHALTAESLNFSRQNTDVFLHGSIRAGNTVNFAADNKLFLENDVTIKSAGTQNLAGNIQGAYGLELDSGSSIKLNKINTGQLKISRADSTELHDSITTLNDSDFSGSKTLRLMNDISLVSSSGKVNISSQLEGKEYSLSITAGDSVTLANTRTAGLTVSADELSFDGNLIDSSNDIDFSQVGSIELGGDTLFKSENGNISLPSVSFANKLIDFTIQADTVELHKMSDVNELLSSINVEAEKLVLNNNILAAELIDFSNTNIYLKQSLILKTAADAGVVNMSNSTVSGKQNVLDLSAADGTIYLGKINRISALNVFNQGRTIVTDNITTLYNQDFTGAGKLTGNAVDLKSLNGSISLNNVYSNSVNIVADKNIVLLGSILADQFSRSYVAIESLSSGIRLTDNSEINAETIRLKAGSDITLGHLNGNDIEVRSTQGSIVINTADGVNVRGDRILLSAGKNIGSLLNPVNVNVNTLIIDSAQKAVINGLFKIQKINDNTRLIQPKLEFLASEKAYSLNVSDFTFIDSGIFMNNINLFSVSDDAVLINEDIEDIYSDNEKLSNDLTINLQ